MKIFEIDYHFWEYFTCPTNVTGTYLCYLLGLIVFSIFIYYFF